ncbi:DUF6482 family protein [Paraglaciecola sp.]|uniref:DUF6482 family protein n=1 Tax=Paraglaciecola sp. TaxID=1920173 RepID=UPI003EF19DB0
MMNQAKIIGHADAQHYLVGAIGVNDSFVELPMLGRVVVCQSLHEAKAILRDCKISRVQLTLNSAYDEMCGMPTCPTASQTIDL